MTVTEQLYPLIVGIAFYIVGILSGWMWRGAWGEARTVRAAVAAWWRARRGKPEPLVRARRSGALELTDAGKKKAVRAALDSVRGRMTPKRHEIIGTRRLRHELRMLALYLETKEGPEAWVYFLRHAADRLIEQHNENFDLRAQLQYAKRRQA